MAKQQKPLEISRTDGTPGQKPLPKGFPPELIPLYDWWTKNGKSTIFCAVVAVAAAAGVLWYKNSKAEQTANASAAIISATAGTAELETALDAAGSSPAAASLRIKLANSYFADGNYDAAIETLEKAGENSPEHFPGAAAFGKAACIEAKKDKAGAHAAYEAFLKDFPKSYLALEAKIGAARTLPSADEAEKALAALREKASEAEAKRIDEAVKELRRPPAEGPAPVPPAPVAAPAPVEPTAPEAPAPETLAEKQAEQPAPAAPAETPAAAPSEAPAPVAEAPATVEAPAQASAPAEPPAPAPAPAPETPVEKQAEQPAPAAPAETPVA